MEIWWNIYIFRCQTMTLSYTNSTYKVSRFHLKAEWKMCKRSSGNFTLEISHSSISVNKINGLAQACEIRFVSTCPSASFFLLFWGILFYSEHDVISKLGFNDFQFWLSLLRLVYPNFLFERFIIVEGGCEQTLKTIPQSQHWNNGWMESGISWLISV